ncbi:MAG: WG repeat-containing protein [Cytophagales bacterium]|nr:WG repeat-containing protein [Cytophagales bacterium]
MKKSFQIFSIVLLAFCTQCTVLRKDDPQQHIKIFLTQLQQSLTKPDDEILGQFKVSQSRAALLSVIQILQNKDAFVVCESDFNAATVTSLPAEIQVEVPVKFYTKELSSNDVSYTTLVLALQKEDAGYKIVRINGEAFYQEFIQIKNANAWEATRVAEEKARVWLYEKAHELESKFDSVVWFTTYGKKNFFYVVTGRWVNVFLDYNTRNEKLQGIKMGLADAEGNLLIPQQYDLIGTIGFEKYDLVEVVKDNKVGYFNITKGEWAVPVQYDQFIPYNQQNVWALVKQGTTIGWLDHQFNYHSGFATDKMKTWYENFDFLKTHIQLKAGQYVFSEIPLPEYAAHGIIIPSSYLSSMGVFNQIEGGFSLSENPINAYTEYKETTGSFLERISKNLSAIVVSIRERYLEGREEFYDRNQITFIDEAMRPVGNSIISGRAITMHLVDSTLLEVRTPHDYWFNEEQASTETNLLEYIYFTISPDRTTTRLPSRRLFAQTQYVRLDSSYLSGRFTVYDQDGEQETSFLSAYTLAKMRDEILGANGYTFPDYPNDLQQQFSYLREKNDPTFNSIDEVIATMSEIDRYNYEFLSRLLARMQTSS